MKQIVAELGIGLDKVCHIADDVNDVSLLEGIGFPVTVPGGMAEVQDVSRFVTRAEGGNGAVRELCERLLPL